MKMLIAELSRFSLSVNRWSQRQLRRKWCGPRDKSRYSGALVLRFLNERVVHIDPDRSTSAKTSYRPFEVHQYRMIGADQTARTRHDVRVAGGKVRLSILPPKASLHRRSPR